MKRASEFLVALVTCGCSLGTLEHEPCTTSDQCRASFGLGAVCAGDGFCQKAPLHPRCNVVPPEPQDLFSRPERYEDAILLGTIFDHKSTTKIPENVVRLAFRQMNDAGGLDGREFAVVFCTNQDDVAIDALDDKEASAAISRHMAESLGVPGIIGTGSSEFMTAAFKAVQPLGTFFITPAATSPTLTSLDPPTASDAAPGLLWRTAPTDALEARVIAADMLTRGVTRIALILESGSFGEGFTEPFGDSFGQGGGQAIIYDFETDSQLSEAINLAALDDVPEVFVIASQKDQIKAFLINIPSIAGYATKNVVLSHGGISQVLVDEVVTTLGAGAAQVFAKVRGGRPAQRSADSLIYDTFAAAYRTEFSGEDPAGASWSAHRYDASWLAFYGVAWSALRENTPTGRGMARGLRRVSGGLPIDIVPSKWNAVVETFRGGASIDVRGASGKLDFDPVTEEPTSAPIELFVIAPDASQASGFAIKADAIIE